ncbi:MAG: hypothetical protein JW833_16465 [Prolixibacteraceae bacterium]|nr:hypothetical protein [Prolixibacteraceae bacterium]
MKTKLFLMIVLIISVSSAASAQLEGKKFRINLEGMGEINLAFKKDVYELSNQARIVLVRGDYQTKENTITFTDTEGPMACQPNVKGEYTFEYNNDELKLEVVKDPCQGRNNMAATAWKEIR